MPSRPFERPRQLALKLPVEERLGREDFLVGQSNETAYAAIEAWPEWPGGTLLLVGPPGSGKSHLATIWARRGGARLVARRDVTPEALPALLRETALAIEDCDTAGADEATLFHLINGARAARATLLLTAASAPDAWGLTTPDLLSRLRLAPLARIDPPDDALLRAVLVKLFVERQLVVDTAVVEFLAQRIERSVAAAREIVERLDRDALASGRRVTRAFAALALREPGEQERP